MSTKGRSGEASSAGLPRAVVARGVALFVLVGGLLAYLATLCWGAPTYSVAADGVLGNAVLVVAALTCLGRAALVRPHRVPFALIGAAAAGFAAGNVVYIFDVQFQVPVPYPSIADIGYFSPYPLLLAAIIALARPDLRNVSPRFLLDGLLGALSCAAAGSVVTVHHVLPTLEGPALTRIVGGAYPVADLVLAALIVGVVSLKGGRPGLTWAVLGGGVVTFAVADTIYLMRVADGTYTVGTPLDGLWAVGLTLMAVAAVLPYRPGERPVSGGSVQGVGLPHVFGTIGVGLLVYGSLTTQRLPVYAVVLIVLTLATSVKRTTVEVAHLHTLARTHRQARTDELTQLPNRRDFEEQVQQALSSRPHEAPLALLVLDIDGFADLNATFGHQAGDELLRQIGPRIVREVGAGDLVARIGGDAFGVLLQDCPRGGESEVAQRVTAALRAPFLVEGAPQTVQASIGTAAFPHDGVDLTVLMQHAGAAMRDAKAHGTGVVVFDHDRLGVADERLDVRGALARRELVNVYQPQFDMADGRMSGVEALVRWQHPTRGLLFPDAFLAFVEQAGLMPELTLAVLDQAARDCRRWRLEGTDVQLSVNLPPSALLQDGLIASIADILQRNGLPPEMLTMEITENVLMADVERSKRTLFGLREMGAHLSLDDFGTGYCSLTYLRDLPLSEVKIDRSFVMGLTTGSTDAAIVASTVKLASALGMRTVAEGVETEEALETLRDSGCDVVQGYLLGRPMPADRIVHAPRPQWTTRPATLSPS